MNRRKSALKERELVVCLGGGYWGAKGAMIAKNNGASAIVIDKDPGCAASEVADAVITERHLEKLDIEGVVLYVDDAVRALMKIFKITTPAWIIPTSPGGFGGRLMESWLSTKSVELIRSGRLVDSSLRGLPPKLVLYADRKSGTIVSSYMPEGLKCKTDCSAPKTCPLTGRRKVSPMYELLEFSICEVVEHYKIFATKQLGGIGGIPGSEVREALEYIDKLAPPYSLAIGTSCRCHGLVEFFEVKASKSIEEGHGFD